MSTFVYIWNQAFENSCPLADTIFWKGFVGGIIFVLVTAGYFALIISLVKLITAFFLKPTQKDGPSGFKLSVGCLGGVIGLVMVAVATYAFFKHVLPLIYESVGCGL